MKQLFTEEDVERWAAMNSRKMAILERRLGNDPLSSNDLQGLDMLSLAHVSAAFTSFARGECDNALKRLRSAVQLKLKIFERYAGGDESAQGYVRTGEFQTVLLGFASGDIELARRFAEAYCTDSFATERSPEDSNYIGLPMKSLAMGEVHKAKSLLSHTRPARIDPQFAGYIDCLSAVADNDLAKFREAVQVAESHWYLFMVQNFQGHPQAVCFVAGLGFQRLAESALKTKFDMKFCCSGGGN